MEASLRINPQRSLLAFVTTSLALMTAVSALQTATKPRAAVVGGSLGGLAAAHALSQTGWTVDVLERSPQELRYKGSGLGFVHTQAWESLTQRPMMRRQRRASRAQGSFYYGDLWGFLYDGLPSDSVNVKFGKSVTELRGSVEAPMIEDQQYDLVVVADGGFSTLREHVFANKDEIPQPEYAGYVVFRGEIPTSTLQPSLLNEIRHLEGVYKNGIYDTIALKMAKDNGEDMWTFGTFIAKPESELSNLGWSKSKDGKARHHSDNSCSSTPDWFLPHMKKYFSHVPGLIPLVEQIAQRGQLKPHPQYEFGNIEQVHNGRVMILGDAAHMASPRTAVGAHTAILDALALREAFAVDENSTTADGIDKALQRYSKDGVAHARQLYARSREVSQEFVPS
jgi:2-polyprenyl-6-methoxyphenol hydroxylase-like FAD-dependent oxidoreductase